MGVYVKSDLIYLNVTEGKLRQKVGEQLGRPQYREFDGFAGVITGVRVRSSQFNQNAPTQKLQLRMVDPFEGDQEYVLSITLLNGDGTVTTGGRMLVTRLINPGNTGPGDRINISVWGIEGTKATCCAPRNGATGEIMPAIEHDKEDRKLPEQITEWVEQLISIYGPFEQDGGGHPAGQVEYHDGDAEESIPTNPQRETVVHADNADAKTGVRSALTPSPSPAAALYGDPKPSPAARSTPSDDVPPPGDNDLQPI